MNHRKTLACLLLATLAVPQLGFGQESADRDRDRGWGRSHHGSHYDEGPRTKPWVMEGIGKTHFPITTSHPDVQQWFDQGNTLLHGFWFFEAERSFRWCLKLDPECAMAYWGLARSVERDNWRERKFFREAVKRKDNVSERERDYLELWEAKYRIKGKGAKRKEAIEEYVKLYDNLLINYPDDMEARALYWLELPRATMDRKELDKNPMRYGVDRVLQEVLMADPDHVGALHYRVHNWDGEEGHYALDTCLHLSKVAPQCGHLQHMPGHVLSSIGLWHEAAIAMDAATRVEKDYMRRRMVLPEHNWDYIHNLDYLTYIQEQLGMYEAALTSCRQLLLGPPATEFSLIGDFANWSMVRLLVKYEKWEEILDPDSQLFRWSRVGIVDPILKSYAESHALLGLGRLDEAEAKIQDFQSKLYTAVAPLALADAVRQVFGGRKSDDDEDDDHPALKMIKIKRLELDGKLKFCRGEHEAGLELLTEAAELQYDSWNNDPPRDPSFLYNTLGWMHLEMDQPQLAVESFEKALEKVINDGFSYSGLVVAYDALDQPDKAAEAMARLMAVWGDADSANPWLQKALATGVKAGPKQPGLMAERSYKAFVLDRLGHSIWAPPEAPPLEAINASGERVTLEDYRGKNVLLIFYLGGECVHCMEQMRKAAGLADELAALDTEVVAVSKDDLETIRSYQTSKFPITLLSDPEFENARRFQSYDDFEELELHSTVLIDRAGRVHWSKHGGEPFVDFDFLMAEIRRLNAIGQLAQSSTSPSP